MGIRLRIFLTRQSGGPKAEKKGRNELDLNKKKDEGGPHSLSGVKDRCNACRIGRGRSNTRNVIQNTKVRPVRNYNSSANKF